jgi:predicted MFS family arabinose efflux permease
MADFQSYFAPLTPDKKGALNSHWRGRRDSIAFFALVFVVGGVLQCAAQNLGMQLVGRFVSGISVGACSVLCKCYRQCE